MTLDRRLFLRTATAGGALPALGAQGTATASAAPAGFPDYRHVRTLLTPEQLSYNSSTRSPLRR
ncbi:hypothetical protein [Streptomyces sp. NPDC058632]|uniref:hypothetical protein n=1 Tax=unclassified Streptomyces TaxID=2593676 RepID=UPI0036501529